MKKGICCAGNMIVDITYPIETWPKQNELTHITEGIKQSTGGSVCNTISDLARLDSRIVSCEDFHHVRSENGPHHRVFLAQRIDKLYKCSFP